MFPSFLSFDPPHSLHPANQQSLSFCPFSAVSPPVFSTQRHSHILAVSTTGLETTPAPSLRTPTLVIVLLVWELDYLGHPFPAAELVHKIVFRLLHRFSILQHPRLSFQFPPSSTSPGHALQWHLYRPSHCARRLLGSRIVHPGRSQSQFICFRTRTSDDKDPLNHKHKPPHNLDFSLVIYK